MIAVHRILDEKALTPPSSSLRPVPANMQNIHQTVKRAASGTFWGGACVEIYMQTYNQEIVRRWATAICTTFTGLKALRAVNVQERI